jgi:hypothetical protein
MSPEEKSQIRSGIYIGLIIENARRSPTSGWAAADETLDSLFDIAQTAADRAALNAGSS